MNLRIREGNINDYEEIRDLVKEVHLLHVKNRPDIYIDIENTFEKEDFEEILNSNNTKVFIAQDINNEEIVAYSIIQIMNTRNIQILVQSKFIYIDDLCVKANHHKKGIGKTLFNYILNYSKEVKASSIQLNVWEFNEDAIKFYESLGMNTRNRRMEIDLKDFIF